MRDDFFSAYLEYTSGTEVPTFFNRWCAIAGLAAYLGRGTLLSHGYSHLYPNIYCMLIGLAGTRKSTAIKRMKKVLNLAGYRTVAADKTTKEKFLLDLAERNNAAVTIDDVLDQNIFGEQSGDPSECFIMADEFNDFFGNGNIEFISLLGTLWDYDGVYESRIKNGKSVSIPDPTISILGGNTPTGFRLAFPPEVLTQGFFSRLILIHSDAKNVKITFPPTPTTGETEEIIQRLQRCKIAATGEMHTTKTNKNLLDKIYKEWKRIDDIRFDSYCNRRLTHLMKLCIVFAAARGSNVLTEEDIIYANTILYHTELLMPKALGEFGKAKNSDITHKIISHINSSTGIVSYQDIWTLVHNDLESRNQLSELLGGMAAAHKLQTVKGGFLPNKLVIESITSDTIDYSFLTDEEKEVPL